MADPYNKNSRRGYKMKKPDELKTERQANKAMAESNPRPRQGDPRNRNAGSPKTFKQLKASGKSPSLGTGRAMAAAGAAGAARGARVPGPWPVKAVAAVALGIGMTANAAYHANATTVQDYLDKVVRGGTKNQPKKRK